MKKAAITIIPPSDASKAQYHAFCKTASHLPIFVQAWYLDAVCEDGKWEVILLEYQNTIIASWPFFIKEKWGLTYVTMPHFVKWMGIYISPAYHTPKNELIFIEKMLPHFPQLASFKQNFPVSFKNWSSLYWKGFQQTTRYTYQLSLNEGLEKLHQQCNRNIQRNLRKAAAQFQIKYDLDAQNFYEVNSMSFKRQGITTPYSFNLFSRHHSSIQKEQSGKIIYATGEKGEIVGVCYLIWDKQRAYYHLSGENPAFRQTGAGILLTWKAIEYSKSVLQVPIFDFEGSMIQGVAQIRQQFGASAIPYSFIFKYSSKLYQMLDFIRF